MKLRLLASVLSVLTFSAQAAAPGHYSVTSLGGMTGLDLNNHGQVVGYLWDSASAQSQAAMYNGGVVSSIAAATGQSIANGINDAGQISGNFGQYGGTGFLYAAGSFTAFSNLETVGIDNNGNVAGTTYEQVPWGNPIAYAGLYSNGQITQVGLGGEYMHPLGISKGGTMYGFGSTASDHMNPFTYNAGVTTNYSSVIGGPAFIGAANEQNQVLGTSMGSSGEHFIYSKGALEYLPAGVGFYGINNSGWAVGGQQDVDTLGWVKGLLRVDGVSYDLNSLIDPASGWTITSANVINENNQILAEGCNASGCQSVLLSLTGGGSPSGSPLAGSPVAAVPEPETYGMMLLGMAAIGVAARRRRKQAAK